MSPRKLSKEIKRPVKLYIPLSVWAQIEKLILDKKYKFVTDFSLIAIKEKLKRELRNQGNQAKSKRRLSV